MWQGHSVSNSSGAASGALLKHHCPAFIHHVDAKRQRLNFTAVGSIAQSLLQFLNRLWKAHFQTAALLDAEMGSRQSRQTARGALAGSGKRQKQIKNQPSGKWHNPTCLIDR
ncbi:hypothetical protein [Cohaesibacter sp. ES.047]|uniref:hypothetical protein n=1 Tax=Cohaesibacter sp. ES.047 TaxID=1798205 RepID=UPI0012FDA4D5|nr:hypothetical protein [Cohaesibacter sp. ES.047]